VDEQVGKRDTHEPQGQECGDQGDEGAASPAHGTIQDKQDREQEIERNHSDQIDLAGFDDGRTGGEQLKQGA